jgi:hypothetical protein
MDSQILLCIVCGKAAALFPAYLIMTVLDLLLRIFVILSVLSDSAYTAPECILLLQFYCRALTPQLSTCTFLT